MNLHVFDSAKAIPKGKQGASMNSKRLARAAVIAVFVATPVFAQQLFIYPAKGQSPQQQQKDDYECHLWAVQQSGYDPARPPAQQAAAPSQPASPAPGSGVQTALKGAVVGGLVGGISGHGGEGAAAGAIVGGIAGRQKSKQQQQQQQQQAAQQQAAANAAGPSAYKRARTGCLTGRGYTVS
jgi:Glycine zipper